MLAVFRNFSRGIVAKILLTLLVLSFGVWGVGDMITRSGHRAVATVGDEEITPAAFARGYAAALSKARQALGSSFSLESMQAMGLPQQVLEELITATLVRQEIKALRLRVPDADVAAEIRGNPVFYDNSKQFSREAFERVLAENNLTEKDYADQIRFARASTLLFGGISAAAPIPDIALATLLEADAEERVAELVVLTPAAVKTIGAPDDAALGEFYRTQSARFSLPEYREFSYILTQPEELAKSVRVSEEEIQALYRERSAMFGAGAEKSAEAYEAARPALEKEIRLSKSEDIVAQVSARLDDALAGGATLAEAAKELGITAVHVGPVSASGKTPEGASGVSPELAASGALETAFSLDEGTESRLSRNKKGAYLLVKVEKVIAAAPRPLESVRAEVEKSWREQETAARLRGMADALAESLSKRKPGEPAAAILEAGGFKTTLSPRLRRYMGRDGQAADIPPALIDEIFRRLPGESTLAHKRKDGAYVIAVVRDRFAPPALSLEQARKDPRAAELRKTYQEAFRQEVAEAYFASLRRKYPIHVNEKAVADIVRRAGE